MQSTWKMFRQVYLHRVWLFVVLEECLLATDHQEGCSRSSNYA